MGVFSPGGGSSSVTADISALTVSTPTVTNSTTPVTANTETSIALPAGTKKFKLRARGNAKLQLAYTATESGTTYWTVMPGACYFEELLDSGTSYTIYIQSNKASTVVELVSWA
jgi:hypothetical protein